MLPEGGCGAVETAQVTGPGLKGASALCRPQCSAQVFLRPLATSRMKSEDFLTDLLEWWRGRWRCGRRQYRSDRAIFRRARCAKKLSLRGPGPGRRACLRPVVNTCMFMEASCCVPQMKSLAGVAAKIRPLAVTFSPCVATPMMAVLPDLVTEPMAFSTMFERPPRLFPGVVLAATIGAAAEPGIRRTRPSRESGRARHPDSRRAG